MPDMDRHPDICRHAEAHGTARRRRVDNSAASLDSAARADAGFLHPNFVLRVAGEPAASIGALSDGTSVRFFQSLRDAEAGAKRRAVEISDKLAERYTSVLEQADKNLLLQLRRDIFNLRPPAERCLVKAHAWLEPPFAAALGQLIADIDDIAVRKAKLAQIHDAEARAGQAALAQCFARPNIASAIQQDNPDLHGRLARLYGAGRSGFSRKDENGLHQTFLTFLLRAALKTSPKSSLTAVALGEWSDGAPQAILDVLRFDAWNAKRRVRMRQGLVRLLLEPLQKHLAGPDSDAILLRNPTLERSEGQYIWRRIQGTQDPRQMMVGIADAIVKIKASRVLDVVLAIFDDAQGGLTPARFAEALAAKASAQDASTIADMLDKALTQGLLVIGTAAGAQADALDWARDRTGRLRTPLARAAERDLAGLETSLATYGDAEESRRGACLMQVEQAFDAVARTLGSPLRAATSRPILHEDCSFRSSHLRLDPRALRVVRGDLDELVKASALFPAYGRLRYWIVERFLRAFGPGGMCSDVAGFLRALAEEMSGAAPAPQSGDAFAPMGIFDFPLAHDLHAVSRKFLGHLEDGIARHAPFAMDGALLARLQASLPDFVQAERHSYCVNGQFLGFGGATPGFVINQLYPGNSRMMSRFLEDDPAKLQKVSRYLAQLSNGRRHAAIPGVFGFNANVHPSLADLEIAIDPFERELPSRPSLNLDDLTLRYEAPTHRLVLCTRAGEPIEAYYFGILNTSNLPHIHQLLDAIGGTGHAPVALARVLADRNDANAGCVIRIPRLCLGSLVLVRATSHVPSALLPDAGCTDAEFFYRLQDWRGENALPLEVFFSAAPPDRGSPAPVNARPPKWRKPMYLDFSNPLAVRPLQRLLRVHQGDVIFAEALPSRSDTIVDVAGAGYVSEISLEIGRGG